MFAAEYAQVLFHLADVPCFAFFLGSGAKKRLFMDDLERLIERTKKSVLSPTRMVRGHPKKVVQKAF